MTPSLRGMESVRFAYGAIQGLCLQGLDLIAQQQEDTPMGDKSKESLPS